MRTRIPVLALAAAAALLGARTASATPVTTTTFTSTIGFTNDTALGAGPFATVDVSLTGDIATITFTADTGYIFQDSNVADLQVSQPGSVFATTNPNLQATGSGNLDGLGTFNFTSKLTNSPPQASSIVFTLTNPLFTNANSVLTTNSSGFDAAAHVLLLSSGGTVTGFAGEVPTPPSVPEPASLVLLGGALLGLGEIVRRRSKRA